MLSDEEVTRLSAQFGTISSEEVRAAYLRFLLGLHELQKFAVRPDSHGFIANEIRAYRDTHWYFSAVLNVSWVLFYFRWPVFRDGLLKANETLTVFPASEKTKAKDIKLRVSTLEGATQVVAFLNERLR